jgi:glycosyltransferase involved in cell wall biosynthesis
MNILGVCLSTGKGGLELYAGKAIVALHKAGHQCHFALSPNSYLKERDWPLALIELQPAFRHFPLLTARRLADYIDAHQIDVIHMHWNKDLNLAALAKLLSHRKPRLVYSRHMEITRAKKDLYHRFLYRQVDLLLVISRFVQEQARRFLPIAMDKVSLLYLGVKASGKTSAQQCRNLLPGFSEGDGAFVIGMIGRIEPYKGQHVLIDALILLKEQGLPLRVAMVGPIMDEQYYNRLLEKIRQNNLSEMVKYLGVTQEAEKLMSCCDVVVLTTYCETFGLVLVEAMRAGTAVVGTNAGGVPEIIRHNETGMLYEPGNEAQLAECLAELCTDLSKRKRLAAGGKEFADKMFDELQHYRDLEQKLLEQ